MQEEGPRALAWPREPGPLEIEKNAGGRVLPTILLLSLY